MVYSTVLLETSCDYGTVPNANYVAFAIASSHKVLFLEH